MNKLTGKKLKMTQIFEPTGASIGVTPVYVNGGDLQSLKSGDLVDVSGTSKGRGFQGVVKRHGFGGGPKTHGQKNRLRAPGSIGNTSPQRVLKGRRMAGHMGVERVTVKNLKVVDVKTDDKLVFLCGAVPGNERGTVEIRKK